MPSASDFHESAHDIADRVNDDMSERDVENLFLETGFYDALGYEGTGTDIRSEFTLPDDRRPDYITLNSNESVSVVYEFKSPSRELAGHEDQLFHYVEQLQADYGVLTNGKTLRVYTADSSKLLPPQALSEVSEDVARDIVSALQKRAYDLTDTDDVQELLDPDPVPLDSDSELGQEHFFDTFRLEEGSPFAELIVGLMDVLNELRGEDDEEAEKFVQGAYDFWEATYASEPEVVPSSWEPFIDGKQSLRDFMFCLETGHALLSRLLLAKATEDHDFFHNTAYGGMGGYFAELRGFGDTINLDAFPVAANDLIDDMQEQLVEGLFQDDIFVWWTVGYRDTLATGHDSGASHFQSIAEEEESGVELLTDSTRDRFSRAVADIFFNILRFDFSEVQGDLLGDLYQRYFDPETRKALGEFYTPQPVVDYIMDGVEYDRGVSTERLMDPACGSGTFLVEAAERYLKDVDRYATGEPDWEKRLRELCTQPHIVGLDIHPFAVLMAQIRFVVAILPEYKKAKHQNQDFTLRRLPIYRTDTLRNERELTGADLGGDDTWQITFDAMTEDDQDVLIPVPLPIEVDEDEVSETEDGFLVRRVRMPLFDTIKLNTGVRNFGEYFAALQGVLDTVKDHLAFAESDLGDKFDWTYKSGLEENVNRYTSQQYGGVEEFFEPYVNDMLENVRYLKEEHNDGRLFKMLEDAVLSLVVKNYMDYEYVVGNPPYVRIQHLPDSQKQMMDQLYDSTTGNYDIYCPFYERGLNWLREDTGKLGYITPNQFMVTDYGEGLRRVLLRDSAIDEVYDFRDSGVFKDATNYPAIVIAEDESDQEERENNEIRCVRVKANVEEETGRALDDEIITAVREHRHNAGYSDEFIDVFDFPQGDLDDGYWSLMPPEEYEVIKQLEKNASGTVEEVTDSVFAGTQTSANDVFLVTPLDADRIEPGETGGTVTVVPKGRDKEYEIETDALRPWLQGRDVERWRGEWSGQHVVVPYSIERGDDGELNVELLSQEYLESELPLTWEFFCDHRDELEEREGGRFEDRDDWYDFGYPKSMDRFENPKLIGAEIASESTFMLDEVGSWYFKAAYGVQLESKHQHRTEVFAGLLNSSALDYYLKHYTSMKMGGYYKYTTNYLSPLPIAWDDSDKTKEIEDAIEKITTALDTDNRTDRFPEAYLGDFDGEIEYITYEWQTRRYPVKAEVQGDVEGEFTVQAGRSDTITDPAMYSDDREGRKLRAEYVYEAVDGRNVKSGEETTIPIPRTDRGVEELLTQLKADEETVGKTDIEELEAEIDAAVYDLFDLTKEEQEVIEDYLEVF
ncbi:N-6 DNA methylase [Halalkaliarchaeum sp. AArc-GB]|uniref:Eco57I restriction-modification methylase domain-containing protein n=1 Tax=Halalkaliarchaeum sp. AArc-GB TaxID=3074078 RepID=UPI00285421EF|nr:N-6 DNA methylase [Halalkaliarchaeum sp. AArc-GB]MDR5672021.1 N-6 DNA methylase [Halalkaliarchaeum sp. AArc-GB]